MAGTLAKCRRYKKKQNKKLAYAHVCLNDTKYVCGSHAGYYNVETVLTHYACASAIA